MYSVSVRVSSGICIPFINNSRPPQEKKTEYRFAMRNKPYAVYTDIFTANNGMKKMYATENPMFQIFLTIFLGHSKLC